MRRRSCTSTQSIDPTELGSWFCSSGSKFSDAWQQGPTPKGTDETEVLKKREGQREPSESSAYANTHLSKLEGRSERENRRRAFLDGLELVDDEEGAKSIQRGGFHVAEDDGS